MLSNIQNGIFTFQVFRGVCWAVFGFTLLYCSTMNSLMRQGFLMGLLFAMVMTAQLLIPNPYMPPDIRAIHALEVGCSNFIWGFTVAYFWKLSLKQPEGR
jgi:hypothetical protein